MKKILPLILLLSSWLFGAAADMAQFRQQQRQLVLAEFRALYKQRHYYQHRSRVLRHHRRVRTLGRHSVWNHPHSEAKPDAAMPQQMMHENDVMNGYESNLKTRANHDLEWMRQHESVKQMQDSERLIEPPFERHDNDFFDGGDMPGGSMTEGSKSGGDTPTDGGNHDLNPYGGGSDDTGVPFPSGTGETVQGNSGKSDPAGSQGSISESGGDSTGGTTYDDAHRSGDTPPSSWTDEGLRPRFADPWRRR